MSEVTNQLSPGFDRFLARLSKAKNKAESSSKSAYVGILGSAGSDLVVIAATNEYGTEKAGVDHNIVIPSRPFFRNAMNSPQLATFVREQAAAYYADKLTLDEVLNRIGAYGQGAVQKSIASNIAPENADSTKARKGSTHTLIDTGRLRQSVAWMIR